jgi:carbon monoxide dehydrogenase subunit G
MDITEQTRIPSPLAEVWPLLSDPATVAGCIPGAQLAPDQVFRGEATLAFDHDAHRCTIEGRGIDQRGASRALSSGTIHAVEESGETLLTVAGSFTVTGPLETFANAGGVHLARALLADFSANMAKLVAERRAAAPAPAEPAAAEADATTATAAPPPAPPPPAPPQARELSAMRLLWQAFRSWLRSLFGNTRKP